MNGMGMRSYMVVFLREKKGECELKLALPNNR